MKNAQNGAGVRTWKKCHWLANSINPFAGELKLVMKSKKQESFEPEVYVSEDGKQKNVIAHSVELVDNAQFIKVFQCGLAKMANMDANTLNLYLWIMQEQMRQCNESRRSDQPGKQTLLIVSHSLVKHIDGENGERIDITMSESRFYAAKQELVRRGLIQPIFKKQTNGYVWSNPNMIYAGKRERFCDEVIEQIDELCAKGGFGPDEIREIRETMIPEAIIPSKQSIRKETVKDGDDIHVSVSKELMPEQDLYAKAKIVHPFDGKYEQQLPDKPVLGGQEPIAFKPAEEYPKPVATQPAAAYGPQFKFEKVDRVPEDMDLALSEAMSDLPTFAQIEATQGRFRSQAYN